MVHMFSHSAKIAVLCLSVAGWPLSGYSSQIANAGETNLRDWDQADRETLRLPPSAFPKLPQTVARGLRDRGCLIPQGWFGETPNNVISGAFKRPGQTDWAVLCSVARRSVILVFWNGSADDVEQVPGTESADKAWLQAVSVDRIGFSRAIGTVGPEAIPANYKTNAGRSLSGINHDGIDEAFMEKGSTLRYWHRGRWLDLAGLD